MKSILKLIFLTLLVMFVISCKKYPKDIPVWLKDRIDGFGKKGGCLQYGSVLTINELKSKTNDSIIYEFCYPGGPSKTLFYDINGNLICEYNPFIGVLDCPCMHTFSKNRNIWTQNPKHCK